MDNELFELCKEVYVNTGWETERSYWSDTRDPSKYIEAVRELKVIDYKPKWLNGKDNEDNHVVPLYTSDYLLEKLPKDIDSYTIGVVWSNIQESWRGEYGNNEHYVVHADTPLKALLKLTLALNEAGEL